ACTQEAQIQKAPQGQDAGTGQGRHRRAVRRVWPAGAGAGLDLQPPDRGGPYRDDPQDQARREGLDQHIPPQARNQKGGRDPNGKRQGLRGGLRRRGQAGPRDVRDERRERGTRARGYEPGRPEASHKDPLPLAGRWTV
ncbi:MAG: LSU ribosomal protein L16p (L10e), partial [uncultured Rubrobacteraceae bacterium]